MIETTASKFLKYATQAAHRQTEQAADSSRIMSGQLDKAAYADLIDANYRVWHVLEKGIMAVMETDQGQGGWRSFYLSFSEDLYRDLESLSVPIPQDFPSVFIDWQDTAALAGALYVLNGSTLGGRYLYRALRKNEQLKTLSEFHFYRACDELPPTYWPAFKARLDAQLTTPEQYVAAERAALAVFAAFQEVYLLKS